MSATWTIVIWSMAASSHALALPYLETLCYTLGKYVNRVLRMHVQVLQGSSSNPTAADDDVGLCFQWQLTVMTFCGQQHFVTECTRNAISILTCVGSSKHRRRREHCRSGTRSHASTP